MKRRQSYHDLFISKLSDYRSLCDHDHPVVIQVSDNRLTVDYDPFVSQPSDYRDIKDEPDYRPMRDHDVFVNDESDYLSRN